MLHLIRIWMKVGRRQKAAENICMKFCSLSIRVCTVKLHQRVRRRVALAFLDYIPGRGKKPLIRILIIICWVHTKHLKILLLLSAPGHVPSHCRLAAVGGTQAHLFHDSSYILSMSHFWWHNYTKQVICILLLLHPDDSEWILMIIHLKNRRNGKIKPVDVCVIG